MKRFYGLPLMILLSLMPGNVHRAVDASGSAYFEQLLCLPGMPDDGDLPDADLPRSSLN